MFKNLKIGVRLGIGFASTLVFLIIIASVSYVRLGSLNNEIGLLVSDKFPKTVQVSDASEAFANSARQLRNAFIYTGAEQQKSLNDLEAQRKIVTENLQKLEKSITSEKGKELLKGLTNARAAYAVHLDKAIELIKLEKKAEVVALMQGDLRKAQTEYVARIVALSDFQNAEVERIGKSADALSESTERLIAILGAAAVLLTLLFAWVITRGITGPVNTTVDAAKKMAAGDFTFKLESNSRDEVGEMARAVAAVQHAVQAMTTDAALLTQAAVAGKLATRADVTKHQGDFQAIVKGVNDTLDAVIGPLNVTAKYVDDISKGVIPPVITDNYNGDFNIIKTNLNNMVKMMSELLAQTDIIIKGAADGELDKRANADLFVGGWNQLVTGVNAAITNIVNPMNVTADYVDKVAKGIIPPVIATEYKGQYNVIKNNLNNMVNMMSDLLAQTDIIIKGAADGELDKRANADLFVGGWNQLVTGVNAAITNIVNPMNVTADYVDKVAKGIIPPVITTEYKGQYNVIKSNLNNMVKMMSELLAQTDIIIKGAADGELDKRANADLFVGGWNQLVSGVNAAITNIVNPMNVTADYVDKVAKGIIPPVITTEYKGQYNVIKGNLNAMVKMMGELLAQTDILIKGAAAGELDKRANADLFVGGWNELVTGVNNILNNVVPPIQDVQRVMAALEQGDMTQTITKAYQGDFNSLKEAINNTIAKLVDTITQINTAADALTNAAGQVSATAQSLSQSSSEQAASVEETTSSMEQMTASISQNTENAKVTDGMASKSAKEAAEGGDAVSKTVDDMKSIAGKIGIIDDIAYQTNLLALNAAIEAARAGDHGKGFAVVAAEVRKLAERSQIAAQEIGNLASSSVKQAERAGALLTEMVPSIRKTSDLVQEIASASQEQSSGVAQINGAMGQLNQTTQQNASASEELAATAEELGAQANELQQTMTFFKLDDGSQLARRTPARGGKPAIKAVSARMSASPAQEGDFERF